MNAVNSYHLSGKLWVKLVPNPAVQSHLPLELQPQTLQLINIHLLQRIGHFGHCILHLHYSIVGLMMHDITATLLSLFNCSIFVSSLKYWMKKLRPFILVWSNGWWTMNSQHFYTQIYFYHKKIPNWVFPRLYYHYGPDWLSAWPLTIHALLHIADSIAMAGPVWTYWDFPMECYCGYLVWAIKSHRFPYLSNHIRNVALLHAIALMYNLNLIFTWSQPSAKGFSTPECMSMIRVTFLLEY